MKSGENWVKTERSQFFEQMLVNVWSVPVFLSQFFSDTYNYKEHAPPLALSGRRADDKHDIEGSSDMGGHWKIIHQDSGIVSDITAQVLSGGTLDGPKTFTIENEETGETREVTAWSSDEVGDMIAAGDFDD